MMKNGFMQFKTVYSNKMSTFEEIYDQELVKMTKSMIEKINALEKENATVRQELADFKKTVEKREIESTEWVNNFLLEVDKEQAEYISFSNDNKRRRIQ
jgi:regulator of replication initiation timing